MKMIKTLQDAVEFTLRTAERLQFDRDAIVLGPSDVLPKDVARPAALRMPPVYERLMRGLRLSGVRIGYFALSPSSSKMDLVSALLHQNASLDPVTIEARTHDLIVVGRDEADLLAVGIDGSKDADVVYRLEGTTAPGVRTSRVAKDFETFIVLAANLNDIMYPDGPEDGLEGESAMAEMASRCEELGCNEEETRFWTMKASL
jgi:hypothetical protein